MGTLVDLATVRRDNAGLITVPALPPGCKGRACPAFAICQGRCETRRAERMAAEAGYPVGTAAAH